MLMSITCYAQFTVFENVDVPSRSSTTPDYGPFSIYEPVPYGNEQYRAPRPKAKQYVLTGYYQDYKGWHSTPIKVSISGDNAKLVGVKIGNNWFGCNSNISEVGAFDLQEIQENFNFKGYHPNVGSIYF